MTLPEPADDQRASVVHGDGGRARPRPDRRLRFLRRLGFPPDPFQVEAFDAIDQDRSVLVSAPTGSGKTLVAAYGVDRALGAGGKTFYTTPLKALSNQKFSELAAEHGATRVGLLTGDTAVRAQAPVVVMTTEVLRNMLLAGSDLLRGLHTVVLDEVHYLQDPYRGGVWEEVLVLTPPDVSFICLSATVANARELGEWLTSVRGPTTVVVERRRPVLLRHHLAVHYRSADGGSGVGTDLLPLLTEDGRPGGEALRIDTVARRLSSVQPMPRWRSGSRNGPRLPFRTPRRVELIEALDDEELLPAIVFIFSRAACDEAVSQCLRDGMRLTDHRQRAEIRRVAELHTESLSDDALEVLNYPHWLEGLESGIAAHHAGMVPAFREAVEECFAAGLLQVVFATETLSLGINMPARTVAIERFDKYGSAGRATLTSGEYAQLTGRAGRRGLDHEGHAVVLWSMETPAGEMARVAVAPPPDLRSAFRPTYNLAVNLVRRFDRPTALTVLRRSFAQWQADANRAARTTLPSLSAHGFPVAGVSGEAGPAKAGAAKAGPDQAAVAALSDRSRRGKGRQSQAARPTGTGDMLVDVLGRRLAVLEELGYVEAWSLTDRGLQLSRLYHESDLLVAETLAAGVLADAEPPILAGVLSALVFERRRARRAFAGHAGRRDGRSDGRGGRSGSQGRPGGPGAFGGPGDPAGSAGRGPGGTARHGGGGHASGPKAAARRSGGDSAGGGAGGGDRIGERRRRDLVDRLTVVDQLAERIRAVEEAHLVPRTAQPEHGLSGAVCSWARGASLRTVLDVALRDIGEIAPGDFVRTVKQLVDLVGQVATVSLDPAVAASAEAASDLLRRDVVAAGGLPDLLGG